MSEQYHDAGELIVKGVRHQIKVGNDGKWHSWPGGEQVTAETREGLAKAIDRHTRKSVATIAVPFTQLSGQRARHGVATGIHSRTGAVLVRWDDGETEQLHRYYGSDKIVTRLSDEDHAEWLAKREQYEAQGRWLKQFQDSRELRLENAVRVALDKAVSE